MSCVCSRIIDNNSLGVVYLKQSSTQKNTKLFVLLHTRRRRTGFTSLAVCCLNNEESLLKQNQRLGYDPAEELLGLKVDTSPRDDVSDTPKPRSWFGPNGQYIRELPCPTCRGRGYTPCTECGIERTRLDCSSCNGKGIMTCHRCSGDCVIWEESIDERPWENARFTSPVKVKEDHEVDSLDVKLKKNKKSKRVYKSPSPEVVSKISLSLKILNAKTGLFSNRMKILHRDPKLRAQRVAAIKKAKRSAAARRRASEALKAFFSDPENRRRRSIAMKGVKFYCSNCGREGHRKHYCPELRDSAIDRRFTCGVCGEKGHNRRTCPNSRTHEKVGGHHKCKVCNQVGHNRRTCPQVTSIKPGSNDGEKDGLISRRRIYTCRLCQREGHNARTCPVRSSNTTDVVDSRLEVKASNTSVLI